MCLKIAHLKLQTQVRVWQLNENFCIFGYIKYLWLWRNQNIVCWEKSQGILFHIMINRHYHHLILPLVSHICISESGQHWLRYWLVVYSAPSHYLNQCWVIVNWILRNKLQWNFNQNTKLFIHKIAFENIVTEMAAILSRGRRVKYILMLSRKHSLMSWAPFY